MTALLEFQRAIASAVMQPLTSRESMRRNVNASRGAALRSKALRDTPGAVEDPIALVKPNSRLSSVERLEIYSRSYWSRILDALGDDFPGVRAVVGAKRFDRLRRAYLADCPSTSFTMRNLGGHLPAWLEQHAALAGPSHDFAADMAKLEWAHIEAFDAAEYEPLTAEHIAALDAGSTLRLQPHLRWITAASEVDSLLLEARRRLDRTGRAPRAFTETRLARARSAAGAPLYFAIHRQDLVVHYKRLDAEMYRLLDALSQAMPIGAALEIAYADSTFTPEQLQQHVQQSFALFGSLGWFCDPGGLQFQSEV